MFRTKALALVRAAMLLVACGPSDEIVQGRVDSAVQAKEWTWLEAIVAKRQLTLAGLAPDEAAMSEAPTVLAQVLGVKAVVSDIQLDTALIRRRNEARACTDGLRTLLDERPIRFVSGAGRVQAASNATLDEVARILGSCLDARYEVRGVVAQGATANERMSGLRVGAVVTYLVGRGVAQERLVAVPQGGSAITFVPPAM